MNAITLGFSRVEMAEALGVCPSSEKIARRANQAQWRLLNRPDDPVGAWVRYRICGGSSGCISWPRQIRTIKAYGICSSPGIIRSDFFEFIGYPNGLGLQNEENMPGNMLLDRGTACSFDNVQSTATTPKKIKVIAQNAADVGKQITLRYYTSTGEKKYSSIDSVVQEGERLTLVAPPGYVLTSSNVMTDGLYHVVKDIMDYPIRLYEVDDVTFVETKLLALYEPSEQVPIYRKSFVPGLQNMSACNDATTDCTVNKQITAIVKLQHVPVVVDNDPFVIGNLPALVLMSTAIERERQNRHDEAAILQASAMYELDGELASYRGDGMIEAIKVQDSALFGAGSNASYGWGGWGGW